ncbi:BMP-binding endothelial regulator protein, partial [Armadillidium nasatum]
VEVKWDGASYVEVKVDPIWRGRTCGLCGNFNGNVTDDKKDKKGQFADTDEDMAISWQSGKTKTCSRRLLRFECPYGSTYMECAPACKPSCRNQTPNPSCHMKRCKPGCYCPPPTVLHRGSCIPRDQCPKRPRKRKGRQIFKI